MDLERQPEIYAAQIMADRLKDRHFPSGYVLTVPEIQFLQAALARLLEFEAAQKEPGATWDPERQARPP